MPRLIQFRVAKLLKLKPRHCLLLCVLLVSFLSVWNSNNNDSHETIPANSHASNTLQRSTANNNSPVCKDGCAFPDSPLHQSIFVYPNPHTEATLFAKFQSTTNATTTIEWPWILQRDKMRREGTFLLDETDPSLSQFALDLLVYELFTSPCACLRTHNPATAKLFFVPFLPSVFRRGGDAQWTLEAVPHTSIYEQALAKAMTGQSYDEWEQVFGLTSDYWKRHQGRDHVVVMPEPLHGLYHPPGKRGFHHYIKTQKQLAAPIVISVELSRTFQETYPQCFQKNIVLPYPNIDGRWFNGAWDRQTKRLQLEITPQQHQQSTTSRRPLWMYYDAGNHGECLALRQALKTDYDCEQQLEEPNAELLQTLAQRSRHEAFPMGMRLATFCPCPGGDSPSAKRMLDAILAGCIPVVLSKDFVWPFTSSSLSSNNNNTNSVGGALLNPHDFAIHLDAKQFMKPVYHKVANGSNVVCQRQTTAEPGQEESLSEYLRRTVSLSDIARLQRGVQKAAKLYAYYSVATTENNNNNPLRAGVLPTGGAAERLLEELAQRSAMGNKIWEDCQQEKASVTKRFGGKMITVNKC
ncbi:Probable glucuronosyltransferase [Seminavis robusta]|uniref:Probable glucuronosyltransferase n=1 Tax=Seminavis robusta TaxID=568900 RepID=A0A9N8DML4_9STRA|nr:Probable glucuronosyltransferase [Seminavis robusta]|eukprot:Sro163_g073350.1 Probable glucuronosyltransferase (580) ;mRNA; f:81549-83288